MSIAFHFYLTRFKFFASNYIDPNGAEAAALVAPGYKKTAWGANIVTYEDQYTNNIFKGYPDAYATFGTPPGYCFRCLRKPFPNHMA